MALSIYALRDVLLFRASTNTSRKANSFKIKQHSLTVFTSSIDAPWSSSKVHISTKLFLAASISAVDPV